MLRNSRSHHRSFARLLALGLAFTTICAIPQAADASATWFGSWDYVLKQDLEGQPQAAFARVRGESGSFLWLSCSQVALDEDQPPVASVTATVTQKQFLGRSDPRGRSTVYWFDDGGLEVGHWIYRDRYGQIAGREQVSAFVDKLAGSQTLVVELSNYRTETQRYTFELNPSDTKNLADRFRRDCAAILDGQSMSSRTTPGQRSLAAEITKDAP